MRISLSLIAFCLCYNISHSQNVGIGTLTPGSGLEVKGNGLGSQLRVTDAASGNTVVIQGGSGANLKITGYNYGLGTAQPLYLSVDGANTYINPNSGNVGIGTTTPANKLTVFSSFYGLEHTDGSVRMGTFINASGGWLGTFSNHSLHFFTNDGSQHMTITPAGFIGIGTTSPGAKLHINGSVKINANQTLEFGAGLTKELNAGKIGYATFTVGALDIVGAGTAISNRVIRFWNEGGAIFGGNVGINTTTVAGFALSVNGNIRTKEVTVETGWADYVFEKDYRLRPIEEVENFIRINHHLPNIPSAKQIEDTGLQLGDIQKRMMEKIEELTLYIIQLKKEMAEIKATAVK